MASTLACVVHVHSTFSDGTATVQEILAAARETRADAVLLTDHDSLEAKRRGLEGWHDGVLLLVGHEVSPRGGHFLAFGTEREIDHRRFSEREVCREVRRRGGFGFAAHPFSRGSRMSTAVGRPHPWPALQDFGCGIELWSLVTDAAERWRSPREAVGFMRRPERAVQGPPPEHLAEWDRLCERRRVPAIGGLDAHQSGIRLRGRVLTPMPHARYFRLLRTHVVLDHEPTGDLAHDRADVFAALREGRCYLALDSIAPARGFAFGAEDPNGRRLAMGAEARAGRWTLRVTTPRPALIRLIRGGRAVAERRGTELTYDTRAAGAHRVEALVKTGGVRRRWIVSNPVYLREES